MRLAAPVSGDGAKYAMSNAKATATVEGVTLAGIGGSLATKAVHARECQGVADCTYDGSGAGSLAATTSPVGS